jgi:flagellar assembly factor FliW
MIVETKYFGRAECTESAVIKFPLGLPGFEHLTDFVCMEQPALRPLAYLQSLSERDTCFLTLPVRAIDPSYDVDINDVEACLLKLGSAAASIGRNIACLAILCTGSDRMATANLVAPVVINISERIGLQIIQTRSDYDYAHPLPPAPMLEAAC